MKVSLGETDSPALACSPTLMAAPTLVRVHFLFSFNPLSNLSYALSSFSNILLLLKLGEWKDDSYHGLGVRQWHASTSSLYCGEFDHDMFSGYGVYTRGQERCVL